MGSGGRSVAGDGSYAPIVLRRERPAMLSTYDEKIIKGAPPTEVGEELPEWFPRPPSELTVHLNDLGWGWRYDGDWESPSGNRMTASAAARATKYRAGSTALGAACVTRRAGGPDRTGPDLSRRTRPCRERARFGPVAQTAEHLPRKQGVAGAIPAGSTKLHTGVAQQDRASAF